MSILSQLSRRALVRDWVAWGLVLAATAALTAHSIEGALTRYRELRSGWSWDLAYYNQWFWAITHGESRITVRPIADYATEGPPVWKTNYLAPIRYAIVPLYWCWPGPPTLLVVHALVFWLVVPASYGLARAESRSRKAGLVAAACVALTPVLIPIAANDFRELQLGLPFAVWAVHGVRARRVWLAVLGVAGLLACRQEYAILVASLAVVPPMRAEGVVKRYRWARALWLVGLGWLTLVFFGYLVATCGWLTPEAYLKQFLGNRPRPGIWEILATGVEILFVGLGTWALLAPLAPRAWLLTLPWLWMLVNGRWAMPLLETSAWHHVRYMAPLAATGIAAGILGGARLWRFAALFPWTRVWRGAGTALAIGGMLLGQWAVTDRLSRAPRPVDREEARELWRWIGQVEPDAGVVAHYDVTAPLSSRRLLYSYVLKQNEPRGFPDALQPELSWVFFREGDVMPQLLLDQDFEIVYDGPVWRVARRLHRSKVAS